MKVAHRLHKLIGELISGAGLSGDVLRDTACGGTHRLPLFCTTDKSRVTQLCNVDMLILKSNTIKVIIEIEESNVKPVQICGKLLASALSSHYIYRNEQPVPMSGSVLFIQILDTSKLKQGALKVEQWKTLEKLIQETIPIKQGKINQYKIVFGDRTQFAPNAETGRQLTAQIEEFLTKP